MSTDKPSASLPSQPRPEFEHFSHMEGTKLEDTVLIFPLKKRLMAEMHEAIYSHNITEITRIYRLMFPEDIPAVPAEGGQSRPQMYFDCPTCHDSFEVMSDGTGHRIGFKRLTTAANLAEGGQSSNPDSRQEVE